MLSTYHVAGCILVLRYNREEEKQIFYLGELTGHCAYLSPTQKRES